MAASHLCILSAACLSAQNARECFAKAPTPCNWLTPVKDAQYAGGVCVASSDGLNQNYPFYTPNNKAAPQSMYQCSYPQINEVSCRTCTSNGCVFQSSFISTCVRE